MSFIKYQQCTWCNKQYPANHLMNLCPDDNRPVEIIIDVDAVKSNFPNNQWYHSELKSLWRFGAMLPLDINNPKDKQSIITLGEGYTPEIPLIDFALAKQHKFSITLKDEGQPHNGWGANPTGSFKDRGMTMAVSMAKHFGVGKVVVPTQGNAGDSMVEYAMKAGMEAVVIMPDDTPMPIMGRVSALANMHDNVSIELVKGTIREAGELMKSKYVPQGFFNMATFQEPGWRIDGKKTLGYEVAEPRGKKTEWQLPDVILYPTGGGTGILGMWKAFSELEELGLIGSERPKIISVQSTSVTPVVTALEHAQDDTTPVAEPGHTIATGLNVPGGVGQFKVLKIIRESGGAALAISDEDMIPHLKETYQKYGIWICPEGAATLAAVAPAIEQGLIKAGDNVVAFNTGSFEKYLNELREIVFLDQSSLYQRL
ncbi:MAG: threonine synthase [Kangiellaceae bacterium]|jgi:threonine synthase|nr:threonine synthase [Kangiellaceae bacterium]